MSGTTAVSSYSRFVTKIVAGIVIVALVFALANVIVDEVLPRVEFVLLVSAVVFLFWNQIRITKWLKQIDGRVERADSEHRDAVNQTEALISLVGSMPFQAPLPATGVWAAAPDFLREVALITLRLRPGIVVEASSGVSTIVIANALRSLGEGGKVISLEHDADFAEKTRCLLNVHGLGDFAEVHHAPLCAYSLASGDFPWYRIDAIAAVNKIDMLVIDGPPAKDDQDIYARYAALPLLHAKLSDSAVVVLDDAGREGEQWIITKWLDDYPAMRATFLPLQKGFCVLEKEDSSSVANRIERKA